MPSERILFFTDGTRYSLRDRSKVRSWLNRIAALHGKKISGLTYIFVDDKKLLSINRQFLNHNTLTDIITFPLDTSRGEISGEIYISIDRIKDNAISFNQTIKDELCRVMAHGLLHLCGFKDKSIKEQSMMRTQEEKALDLRTF